MTIGQCQDIYLREAPCPSLHDGCGIGEAAHSPKNFFNIFQILKIIHLDISSTIELVKIFQVLKIFKINTSALWPGRLQVQL